MDPQKAKGQVNGQTEYHLLDLTVLSLEILYSMPQMVQLLSLELQAPW
jgi:hypothetical protein